MSRGVLLAALALAAPLAVGCPIPQAVPEYPKGTSITPPRIVAETAAPPGDSAIIRIPIACYPAPIIELSASLVDENTTEAVQSRWFINYAKDDSSRNFPVQEDRIEGPPQADPNQPVTTRLIPAYTFAPYDWRTALGDLQIVELVISNGFQPTELADPLPHRTPLPDFETQVYRWVFLLTGDPCPAPP